MAGEAEQQILERLERNFDAGLERLFSLLRIESISTDPAYKSECRKAADWCAEQLTEAGIPASVRQTTGHPIVVGHDREKKAKGTVPTGPLRCFPMMTSASRSSWVWS